MNITFECRPAQEKETHTTALALKAHTEQAIGMSVSHEPFGLVAYEGEKLIGSVIGKIYFNWLHIDLIWVDEEHRGKGMGRQLMDMTRAQALKLGLAGIEVWTQNWQAPDFYRRLGYNEFAVLEDFTPGRTRHAFRCYLKGAA